MSDSFLFYVLAALVAAAIVAGALLAWRIERRRVAAIAALARRLGLDFSEGRDHDIAREYEDFDGLHEGENRYAFDVLTGTHGGRPITAFNFHFESHSTDSKGNRQTSHHYRHVLLLHLGRNFPGLRIRPEGVLSKIAQAFGYDDIDFESHEFSRRFCVRSRDRKYAYDFCNARMIAFLLDHPPLRIETRGAVLAIVLHARMNPATLEAELDLLRDIRTLMPDYLFTAA